MTLIIELSPQLQKKLSDADERRGITTEEHAARILDQNLPMAAQERAENIRAWLQRIREQGDNEGDCSWDEILQRIDDARVEGRKLFPPEAKGVSW